MISQSVFNQVSRFLTLLDRIATAYESNRLIVITNLPFENGTGVLGSERLTGAA
jgi:hypothetical protein